MRRNWSIGSARPRGGRGGPRRRRLRPAGGPGLVIGLASRSGPGSLGMDHRPPLRTSRPPRACGPPGARSCGPIPGSPRGVGRPPSGSGAALPPARTAGPGWPARGASSRSSRRSRFCRSSSASSDRVGRVAACRPTRRATSPPPSSPPPFSSRSWLARRAFSTSACCESVRPRRDGDLLGASANGPAPGSRPARSAATWSAVRPCGPAAGSSPSC